MHVYMHVYKYLKKKKKKKKNMFYVLLIILKYKIKMFIYT